MKTPSFNPEQHELFQQLLKQEGIDVPISETILRRTTIDAPLSHAQKRLWLTEQIAPASSAYAISFGLRIRGHLNLEHLQKAVQDVVQRHEVLRARFVIVADEPRQVFDTEQVEHSVAWEFEDISAANIEEQETCVAKTIQRNAERLFNLQEGRLLRAILLRLGEHDHVLGIVVHHIVWDAWSTAVFLPELFAFYGAQLQGRKPALPRLEIQYGDYAAWDQERVQLDSELNYWEKCLANKAEILELRTDYARQAMKGSRGGEIVFEVQEQIAQSLKQLAQRENATLFMVLLAGFYALLWRYTEQHSINVGTPVAGRSHYQTEKLIGCFVNMLVLNAQLNGRMTFLELVRQVRESSLEAYLHQDVPFEKVIEKLHPARDTSRTPLFQVTFALQKAGAERPVVEGLEISGLPRQAIVCNYDISVEVHEHSNGLRVAFSYDADLFAAESIGRMGQQFVKTLARAAKTPDDPIQNVVRICEEHRRELQEWNRREWRPLSGKPLQKLFESQAERRPDAVAAVCGNNWISYRELNRRANQLAHYLRSLGVRPGALVGLCLERSLNMLIALLGIVKAAAGYVPLDVKYPAERLSFIFRDSGVIVIATQMSELDRLPSAELNFLLTVSLDKDAEELNAQPDTNIDIGCDGETPAYLMYTSGSTGEPKGVMVLHRAIERLVTNTDYVQLGPDDHVAQVSNPSFDATTFEIWGALLNGAVLELIPDDLLLDLGKFQAWLQQRRITILWLTTSLLNEVIREKVSFAGVQLLFGGEMADANLIKELANDRTRRPRRLVNGYGPTEGTTFSAWHEVNAADGNCWAIPIGRALANTEVYVVGSDLELVPLGARGELCISGAGLATGYVNRPELTAESFVPNPFSGKAGERMYRSGDVARWGSRGHLECIGRNDSQVKIRGFRIEPGEIEAALKKHDGVSQVLVLYKRDEKKLVAFVVKERAADLAGLELKSYLRGKLPEYMVPSAVIVLDQMPLTPNGKVDRDALLRLDLLQASRASVDCGDPRTEIEKTLCTIWQEVLGVEHVGIYDNFFELGGDSILSIRVKAQAQSRGLEFPLDALFEQRTIFNLAPLATSVSSSASEDGSARFDLLSDEDRRRLLGGDAGPVAG